MLAVFMGMILSAGDTQDRRSLQSAQMKREHTDLSMLILLFFFLLHGRLVPTNGGGTMRIPVRLTFGLAIVLMCALPVFAQNTSGSITGVVQDPSGAVIPGVRIVLLNQDQGIEARQTVTNEVGLYVFSALPGATYTVSAELPGFKAYKKTDIKLFVNDRLGLPPIVLEVGAVSESVNVEAEAIQLETVSAERSGVITGRQMVDIALNG